MCPNGDNTCTQLCGSIEGQRPAAGIVEKHRDSFPDEVMLEVGLQRWIKSRKCPGRGQGKKRRRHSQKN